MKKNIDESTKQKIIHLIQALLPQAKIYLFGSRARASHTATSDIDIALNTGALIPIAILDEIQSVLKATNLPYIIEVVDYHRVSDLMREAIDKEGVTWNT